MIVPDSSMSCDSGVDEAKYVPCDTASITVSQSTYVVDLRGAWMVG